MVNTVAIKQCHKTSLNFCFAGVLGNDLLGKVMRAKCGDESNPIHIRRKKRFNRLGSTVWTKELMPLSISVQNAPRGYSIQDIENIAVHCAKVRYIVFLLRENFLDGCAYFL